MRKDRQSNGRFRKICVFCSSSSAISTEYFDLARALGQEMAARGHTLVYGGANVGLMGTLAESVQSEGGAVVGVIPTSLHSKSLAFSEASELIIVKDMHERKAVMARKADAFIALPGGFGTLEELLEILTLKQLHYHDKAVVILNGFNFYEPLLELFEHIYANRFAKAAYRSHYFVATDVESAFGYIDTYQAGEVESKWFGST